MAKDYGGIIGGREDQNKLHSDCDENGCGVNFLNNSTGQMLEMERDEAIIVPEAFKLEGECFRDSFCKSPIKYKMTGTISQIASAINALGGGTNFDKGAKVWKNGRKVNVPRKMGYKHKKPFYVDGGSVVINRTNMLNPKVMTFEGTTYEIASQINSYGGNGVELKKKGGKLNELKAKLQTLRTGGSVSEKNKGGDCYVVAGTFAITGGKGIEDNDYQGTPYLVHAQVIGQGEIAGIPYGHAFIEDDIYVYDYSNNRSLVIPKELYYSIGQITTEAPYYYKYTFDEARRKMLDTGHYGSWDLKTDSGL
jgi:hypothetical protein